MSWVVPDQRDSEHPPASIRTGQAYVTRLINAVMQSPEWYSTAIFLAWDDWGGFYDHVAPPHVDDAGYGLRVPGPADLAVRATGSIDHQTLSFDAYLKFIEDDFLGGQRIDPATDGRPDSRPSVRENAPVLGNLASEFDFTQPPRPPVLLPPFPPLARSRTGHRRRSGRPPTPAPDADPDGFARLRPLRRRSWGRRQDRSWNAGDGTRRGTGAGPEVGPGCAGGRARRNGRCRGGRPARCGG